MATSKAPAAQRKILSCLGTGLALILLSGCLGQTNSSGTNLGSRATAGELVRPNTPDGVRSAREIPPDVMTVPNLPVPDGAQVLLGDTVIVGNDDSWTGQVVMLSEDYSPVQMVEFMRTTMPEYGWEETAIVRSRRTSITYAQAERVATVRIMYRDIGTEIDVVVAPIATK